MTQTTAIATRTNEQIAPVTLTETNKLARIDLRELKQLAEIMVASGAFEDVKDVAKAQVKIMAGAELGFSPLVSMTGIHFFKGKVVIGANLIASLIKESPKYDYEVVEHTNQACGVQFFKTTKNGFREPLGPPVRYTIEEAKTAGLLTKDTWQKYPADLLFAAVMRQGSRRHCADILRGVSPETDEAAEIETQSQITTPEGDTVDRSTGEVIAEAGSPVPQPSTEQNTSVDAPAPTDEDSTPLFTGAASSAVAEETTDAEIVGWINSLGKLKFGDDRAEFEKFLNGRNPAVMPRSALIKLHGELAAL